MIQSRLSHPPTSSAPLGHPVFLHTMTVATPDVLPAMPESLDAPIPTSPTVCLQIAEEMAPTLSQAQLGLLHYIAFVMLTTDGAPYYPDCPQAEQTIAILIERQFLVAAQGGVVLSNLGHAINAHTAAEAIR